MDEIPSCLPVLVYFPPLLIDFKSLPRIEVKPCLVSSSLARLYMKSAPSMLSSSTTAAVPGASGGGGVTTRGPRSSTSSAGSACQSRGTKERNRST